MALPPDFEKIRPSVREVTAQFSEFEHVVSATLGAFILLNQIDRLKKENSGKSQAEIEQMEAQLNQVLAQSLIAFQEHGIANNFFDANGLPPDYSTLTPSLLFSALAKGFQAQEYQLPINSKYPESFQVDTRALLEELRDAEYISPELATKIGRLFLNYQAEYWTNDLLSAVQIVLQDKNARFFEAIALSIDELCKKYAPYNQQVYMLMMVLAAENGERLNLPPYKERKEYSHIYIGTVARARAGKNTVASFLKDNFNFESQSLSTILKFMLAATGNQAPYSRDLLIEQGKKFKAELGTGTLIEGMDMLFSSPGRPQHLLFDGLRTPQEWETIQKLAEAWGGTAILISLETEDFTGLSPEEALRQDQEIRFRRALAAGESKDPHNATDFEAWKATDDSERQGIDATAALATHRVINRDGKEAETLHQLQEIADQLGLKHL